MYRIAALLLLAVSSSPCFAQVSVKDAWVRATVPHQKATGAFLQLTAARDSRLVEVRSPVAGSTELHEMSMANNVMKMRAVAAVELPAGKSVEFKPGGYHIMLLGLKAPVKEGESVPLTLVVEGRDGKRESVEAKAIVRPLTAHGGAHKGH
jgi:periplasmic copper chaperone A